MNPLVWLITGSSSGFGAEFVNALIRKGDRVIATARDISKIQHFKEEGATVLQLDLTSGQEAFNKLATDAIAIYGKVDVLVNNAGYAHFGTVEDDSRDDWIKQFQTHVFGPIGITRAFLPHFRARKSGTIVFMGSTAAWGGMPTLGAYCASKSAIRSVAETLRLELDPLGIKTLLVEPGFFRTDFLKPSNTVYIDTKIEDYEPVTKTLFTQFKDAHHQQPGDPAKGVARVIDVITFAGDAAKKPFPVSLALGSDAITVMENKCTKTLELLKEWETVSSNTTH
ncbi:oxidoreductase,short chain dehydrogenase-like protein [Dendryphion nanum]|uniref:Oxidoreductase,short chain dehydrogenase-like protein n=1 Tax=Dendryphion nanum TaxID=256645 RepID=A0A9P9D4S4_9PLEO|nr:oxidoreductase,short chain dehydrogenase-like protein [Dendryphion nanum]